MSALIHRLLEIPFILWVLIAGGVGYYDYYELKNGPLAQIARDKEMKTTELRSLTERAEKIDEFKKSRAAKLKQLQDLGERFKATSDRLPRAASIPDLLKSLADISDKSGLEFSKFRPSATRKEQFLVITPLEVNLKGTYVQIMTFLDAAANLTRVVASEKLSIEGVQNRSPVNIVTATASLVTYHIDDNAPLDAPAGGP